MGWCHFLTGCVLFWEMDPVFFGWERVNPLWYGRENIKPVYVVPVGICLFVVVKKENSLRHVHQSVDYGCDTSCNTRGYLFVCCGKKEKTHCILKASVMDRFHSHSLWVL